MVGHAMAAMESGDVPGRVRAQFADQEAGDVRQFPLGVVEVRNDQGGYFQMPVQAADMDQIFEYGRESGRADIAVKIVCERL